jgi:drug/metabolite transporter (DMT)-like permease
VGFGIYAIAAIFYVVAIKRIPISIAFPSVSLSYVAVALVAHVLWGEPFGMPQLAGIALIAGGILLLHQG